MSADLARARLRALTAAAFIPARVETSWRPLADKTASDFVDSMSTCSHPVDVMHIVAVPLPVRITCRVLGIPEDDAPAIRAWSGALLAGEGADGADRAAEAELSAYLSETICWYRRHGPHGTLLADLMAARGTDGDQLDDAELVSTVSTLILAGHRTTSAVIGTGLFSLLTTPGAWISLHRDPAGIPSAVEDILRAEIPDHGARTTLITEGAGVDYSLGAALARVELHAAFGAISARLPGLRLAVEPEQVSWLSGSPVRCPAELPVDW